MTDEIQPALTPEQWAVVKAESVPGLWASTLYYSVYTGEDEERGFPPTEHGCAAISLYGQPFGFTAEDVTLLREASLDLYRGVPGHEMPPTPMERLADRIAALLPQQP